MHWNAVMEIALGSLPGIGMVMGFLFHMDRKLSVYIVEHEMLIQDFCQRKQITVDQLPTRSRA